MFCVCMLAGQDSARNAFTMIKYISVDDKNLFIHKQAKDLFAEKKHDNSRAQDFLNIILIKSPSALLLLLLDTFRKILKHKMSRYLIYFKE